MATFSFYNHTIKKFNDGDFDASDTYKVMLLSADATFDATDTTLAAVSNSAAYEVYGNGWAQGGEAIANVTITTPTGTANVMMDGDDISKAITGGSLGPFSSYVIYNDTETDDPPVGMVVLDAPQTINENYLAVIEWDVDGIILWDAQ